MTWTSDMSEPAAVSGYSFTLHNSDFLIYSSLSVWVPHVFTLVCIAVQYVPMVHPPCPHSCAVVTHEGQPDFRLWGHRNKEQLKYCI